MGFLLGYINLMMFSPMGSYMTELFPTAVRGVSQGFCYNAGRGIGAIFPALVGFLAGKFGLGNAIVVFSGCGFAVMIVALLMLDKRYLQNVGLNRDVIRATAGLSGPYDFVPSPSDRGVFSMRANDTTPPPDIEPINFVDGTAPSMLLIQGLSDPTVDPQNAFELAAKIRSAGGNVQCITYPGVGHVGVVLSFAWPFRWLAPTLRDMTDYFAQFNAAPAHRGG